MILISKDVDSAVFELNIRNFVSESANHHLFHLFPSSRSQTESLKLRNPGSISSHLKFQENKKSCEFECEDESICSNFQHDEEKKMN